MSTPAIDYDALAAQHGGTAQIDYDALAAQHGGTLASEQNASGPAAPDSRNAVQKFVDNLTTVTPEQEQGHSALVNEAQKFGAGAIQAATQPFVHPEQTLEGMGHMIAHPIDSAVAMGKNAAANPAQFAGNLVGGAVLGEGVAAPIAEGASNLAGRAASAAGIPERLYQSALKPSTTLSPGERSAITQTGLQNAVPISADGLEKIGDLIGDYNTKIKATIAADPTRQISTAPALQNLQTMRAKFQNQVAPSADLNAIDQVGQEFQGQTPTGSLPADQAQAMKQGTYQALGSKSYGEVKGASIEAQKAIARGLKQEIATQFPEIGNLNAGESKLLDLQPVLERAVNRNANHQLIGIGTPIIGTAVHSVTGSGPAGLVSMLMKSVVDDPLVKSRLAISLSKGAKIPYVQAAARVQAYSAALGSTAGGAQGYSSDASPSQ